MRVADWIVESGIGETRAALIENGEILEARVAWDDDAWPVGTVTDARMGRIDRARGQALVLLPDGAAAILDPLPPQGIGEGMACRVEIIRAPLVERDRLKWPKARLTDASTSAPDLARSLDTAARTTPHGKDVLEDAGWSELVEEAATGRIAFPGGMLHMSLTPAMTLFDVDGALPRAQLAIAGAEAAARAIRRHGIGGSIGIDLPNPPDKAGRLAAAAAIDALLPQPFERTAVNGFGFVQIVRPRRHASLPERIAADPARAAAHLLLRRAERVRGSGAITLSAGPPVIDRIDARPDWRDMLAQRTGRPLLLRADPDIPTWSGHAEAQHP